MALLERDEILADLREELTRAMSGHGRVALLRGEAGVGKTALLDRFARGAPSGVLVLLGACDPLNTPRPLGPLADVVPGLGPAAMREYERGHDSTTGVAGVFRVVMDALRAGPTKVLVFEDVHWADEATLDLMRLLGRRINDRRAMLVASYRDDEIGPTHRLRILLGDLAGVPWVRRYAVPPLSEAAVARLAAGQRRDVPELYRVTGGNPFFVTEVLASEGEGIPETVTDAVVGRLTRVSPGSRRAAEVVAVLGIPAPVHVVGGLIENTAEAIEELVGAGLLIDVRGAVAFRHELARMAVVGTVPGFRRTTLHAAVLNVLRVDPATREDSALLAHHAELAGDKDAVLTFGQRAAARAAAVGAHQEAASHYERLLRSGAPLPLPRRASLLERLAREHFMSSHLAQSIDATKAALQLRESLGDVRRQGENLRWLSFVLWPVGRGGESKRAGRRAVEVLEALPPSPELAWAYTNMCQLSAYDQDGVAIAEHYAERAVTLGKQFDNPEIVEQALFHLAATRYLCADDSADGGATDDDAGGDSWADMEQARERALAAGLVEPATFMAMVMGGFGTLHREHSRAFAALDLVEKCALDYDIPTYLLVSRGARAFGLVSLGRWMEAADLAELVLNHPMSPPIARIFPLTASALGSARQGDMEVWPLLDEALHLAEPTGLIVGPTRAARAEVAWLAGNAAQARTEAQHGLAATSTHTDPWATGELARWLRIAGGEPPAVRTTQVHALEQAGDWESAARLWSQLGCPYDGAVARLAGNPPAIIEAVHMFESLGARPAAAIGRARLRAQGIRYRQTGPRPRTKANPYMLTARQLEILDLIREGLTTRQIAARLHISPKTADHHITAILTKMNVHSRADAARKLPP
jgi:DNA-binding CsgD family transcriptional regulator